LYRNDSTAISAIFALPAPQGNPSCWDMNYERASFRTHGGWGISNRRYLGSFTPALTKVGWWRSRRELQLLTMTDDCGRVRTVVESKSQQPNFGGR
jgi:hypothetical protein